jgi:hypothetical protein
MELTQEKYLELENRMKELESENKKLTENISNQNSYITKLEDQVKKAQEDSSRKSTPASNTLDPKLEKIYQHAEKSFLREVVSEAEQAIIAQLGLPVYEAIKPDFKAFLDKNLNSTNAELNYILSAFDLVLGRAYKNKEHAVHKVGMDPKQVTPPTTPNQNKPTQRVGVMTPNDNQSGILGTQNPAGQTAQPKSIREAWNMRFGVGKK